MSSKRKLRRDQCGHKIKYKSRPEAIIACVVYRRDFGRQHRMIAYRCKWCGEFHIGHGAGNGWCSKSRGKKR